MHDVRATTGEAGEHPPKPRLALRVGVVGHRPDRLPSEAGALRMIEDRLGEVLSALAASTRALAASTADSYAPGEPVLRAISPLAEGADRLFARAALDLGYELVCVMPFARDEFERDFAGHDAMASDALESFRELLDEAAAAGRLTAFELDGEPDQRTAAYEEASELVLNQSDILVAVWDGGEANGLGGTAATLRRALDCNVPVVWIDARPPHGWRILRDTGDWPADGAPPLATSGRGALAEALEELVAAELTPGGPAEGQTGGLLTYLRERRPRFNLALAWKLFRDLVDRGQIIVAPLRTRDFVSEIAADWPDQTDGPASDVVAPISGEIKRRLRGHYAWADKLADRYADAHRSAFVVSSLLAASAVFLALLPTAAAWAPSAWPARATSLVEAAVLAPMILLLLATRNHRWHRCWTEYRLLAELIRELRVLIPLGGGPPPVRNPAHLRSYGDPTQSWMFAHAGAIARDIGLPAAKVDRTYIRDQIALLQAFVGERPAPRAHPVGQLGFHVRNCERMERIHRRLHRAAFLLFVATMLTVVLDFVLPLMRGHAAGEARSWAILVSAFFPALGAALASINNQGEFARLQRRSRAMAQGLGELRDELQTLAARPDPRLGDVAAVAGRMVTMMIEEAVDWRIVVLDLPHAAG